MISREFIKEENGRLAVKIMEDSARTLEDFENLALLYDRVEENRMRNVQRNEILLFDKYKTRKSAGKTEDISAKQLIDNGFRSDNIIPLPFGGNAWWRQLLNGSYLHIIFDCPHEIHENIANSRISEALRELNENEKEILYYSVIREWSPQKLATFRGQSDRNIRRIYDGIMETIRRRLKITRKENAENE